MKTMTLSVYKFIKENGIVVRPNSDAGLWCIFLLPVCILVSAFKHSIVLTENYKSWSIFSFGLLWTSLLFYYKLKKGSSMKMINVWNTVPAIVTSILFYICLHKGYLLSLYGGCLSTILYHKVYLCLLKCFPKCFSLGEAFIITQGLLLFLYSLTLNVYSTTMLAPVSKTMIMSSLIVQVGLFGLGLISWTVYFFDIKRPPAFYITLSLLIFFIIVLPLYIILQRSPLLWIINLIVNDIMMLRLVMFWILCCAFATLAVSKQILCAQKASTSVRKVFHILAVLVYIPGLLQRCSFLYLATGVVLGLFIFLELLRIRNMPPLGVYLQDGYSVFCDEKDSGVIALTPMYLLVGCSVPLWIHPAPCDVTDCTMFTFLPLLSGLLSVGVGDTVASIVGSRWGRHRWHGTTKTIEGTLASIVSQLLFILVLVDIGYKDHIKLEYYIQTTIAVSITSLIEAKTDQVDNLILPLIMYSILI